MIENRIGGDKSREVYEAPAAVVLHTAHRELQAFVTPRDLERLTSELGVKYADLVYQGLWFTPTREAIDALVQHVQKRVTGIIRMRFFKGECRVVGRKSPHALYDHDMATYDQGDKFDHTAGEGFVRSGACRSRSPREKRRPPRRPPRNSRPAQAWARNDICNWVIGNWVIDPITQLLNYPITQLPNVSLVRPVRRRAGRDVFEFGKSLAVDKRLFRGRRRRQPGVGRGARPRRRAHARRRRRPSSTGLERFAAAVSRRTRPDRPRRTKTCTRSSSASWSRGSATPASGCTPADPATNRSRSISGSICAAGFRMSQRALVELLVDALAIAGRARRPGGDAVVHALAARAARARRAHVALRTRPRSGATSSGSTRARDECDAMPLGSGAIAGTSYEVDTALAGRAAGVQPRLDQQHRRLRRPRLRRVLSLRVRDGDGAPDRARGGRHPLHVARSSDSSSWPTKSRPDRA